VSVEQADLDGLVARGAKWPAREGATARIQVDVSKPKGSSIAQTFSFAIVDGRVISAAAQADPDASLVLTLQAVDAEALTRDHYDLRVAFMQGRAKVAGPIDTLLSLMPLLGSPEFSGK